MPLDTQEVDLDEEAERLESEIDELAKQLAEISPDNPAYDTLQSKGKQLDTQLSGVEWGREEWDVDQITLSGLTGGEFGRVEDELSDAAASRQRRGGQPGARRVYIVAYGTDDAPYIDAGMDDDEKIAAAANLPVAYLKWAEAQINDLSTVGNENGRQSFTQLVAEKRQEQAQNSTESTSSD